METSFGLDSDLSTFNETAVRHELGIAYGVPPEYIVLNVSAGSVVVDVLIVLPESAAATLPSHEVQRQMASINASALSISLGSQVTNLSSVSVSNRSYMTSRVMLRFREISCFPGHWCTGGAVIPCEGGPGAVGHTYNPFINQDLGSALVVTCGRVFAMRPRHARGPAYVKGVVVFVVHAERHRWSGAARRIARCRIERWR